MWENLTLSKKSLTAVFLTFLVLTGYYTCMGFITPELGSSDQVNVGVMVNKLLQPELYSKDYVFKDNSLFEFYTPIFLHSLSFLQAQTGQFEYALAVYIPMIMLGYLTGMFVFIFATTKNYLISASVAILSSFNHHAIAGTWWGLNGIEYVMPRSLFLLFVPWLFLLLYFWLDEKNWKKTGVLGLTVGLLTHVHPVSGFLFAQIFVFLILIAWGASKKAFWTICLVGLLMLLGALPMLSNFVQTTEQTSTIAELDYESYLNIAQLRYDYSLFPYPSNSLTLFKHPIEAHEQIAIVWVYLFLMAGWLLWALARLTRVNAPKLTKRAFLILLLIQLPLAYLVTGFTAHALIIFSLAYGILATQTEEKISKWDWYFLAVMVLAINLSFVLNYFLMMVLTRWEIWTAASLVVEQARIGKFVYLPFFIFTAKFLLEIYRLLPATWHRDAFVVSICWLTISPSIFVALIPAILCLALLIKLRRPEVAHKRGYFDYMLGSMIAACVLLIVTTSLNDHLRQKAEKDEVLADNRALYDWARTNTDMNALFYFDSLDFRYEAERSITHSWKDLALAYYSKTELVPFYERYNILNNAYSNPLLLQQMALTYQADYLVVPNYLSYKIDQPIAFSNNSYTVYTVQQELEH
jgi:hypothetical protein